MVVDRDANVEPHPLWEYPCVALSNGFTVMEFDFTAFVPEEEMMSSGTVSVDETRCVSVPHLHYVLLPGGCPSHPHTRYSSHPTHAAPPPSLSDLHAVVLWMDYELVPGVELAVQGPVEVSCVLCDVCMSMR